MQTMARLGLFALLGTVAVLMSGPLPCAAPQAPDPEAAINSALQVQKALALADDYLRAGDCRRAVEVLEAELPRINGNRKYLAKLRDAYRGYIPQLYGERQPALAQKHLERLSILDRSAASDLTRPTAPKEANTRGDAQAAIAPAPGPTLAEMAQGSAAPAAKPPATVRAKVDDPFDAANAAKPLALVADAKSKGAQELLAQAETAFGNKRYGEARGLFEQAHEADPKCTTESSDRWAYCKLNHVVEQLNRSDVDAAACADLEREVQAAMELAPRLAETGRWLQTELRTRSTSIRAVAVAVRHVGTNAQGWEVAETTNFRVFHKQQHELVEKAAQVAERTRTGMARKWFGQSGEAWSQKCDLYLHATAQDYSHATGQSTGSPGHSRIETDPSSGRVVARRMDMHCDNPNMLEAVLPHETTHVVLAGQFGNHQVPRWADEGMAVLTEPADKVDLHRRNLARCQREGQLLAVKELMQLNDYPEPRQIGAFYAQSVSLVDYLSALHGPQVFSQFVRDGLRDGYEAAMRRHYGYRDFAELQERWGQQALAEGGSGAVAGR
jgi:tetratricopeptide (TPR) repeat protein